MRKRKNVQKNNGFSLVEILLAIVILALVLTPILQIFLTSANISNRSKQLLGATEVAEMTLEVLNSKAMDGDEGIKEVFGEDGTKVLLPSLGSGYNFSVKPFPGTASSSHSGFVNNMKTYSDGISSGVCVFAFPDDNMMFSLRNVVHNGYVYDVVVSMTPKMTDINDEYYTYEIFLEVYSTDKGDDGAVVHYDTKLIDMRSAVVNKY